jgi:hypothetical protein
MFGDPKRRLGAIACADLFVPMRRVNLHSAIGDSKEATDLLVGLALSNQPEHLPLAMG